MHILLSILIFNICFVSCSSLKKLNDRIVTPSRETKTFTPQWRKNLDPAYLSGNVPIHLNGPISVDEQVFIGSSNKGFLSINEKSGEVLWRIDEDEAYNSLPVSLQRSIIYGTESGRVFSRKMVNGELNYEIDLGASVDGTPIVSNGRLFVQLRNHQIFALDAITGKILWSYKKPVTNKTTIQGVGKGFVRDNKVIFGFADGDLIAFRVESGDILWDKKVGKRVDKFMDLNWDMVEYNGALVITDAAGHIYFLKFKDGEIFHQMDLAISTNLVVFDDFIYFGDLNGGFNRLDKSYDPAKLVRPSNRSLTRVGRWGRRFVVGDINGLVSIISDKGREIEGQKVLGNDLSALFTSPQTGDLGGLIMFTSRGRLYYYR